MGKLSKSDMPQDKHGDPKPEEKPKAKCMHFALGTWIVRKNVRGYIANITKDGGMHLFIEWENGEKEVIVNPTQRQKHEDRCLKWRPKGSCPVGRK